MSEVLTRIREKYPAYAEIPDEKLVEAIGVKYPQYLEQDKGFADEYDKYVEGPQRTSQAESLGAIPGGAPQLPTAEAIHAKDYPPGSPMAKMEQQVKDIYAPLVEFSKHMPSAKEVSDALDVLAAIAPEPDPSGTPNLTPELRKEILLAPSQTGSASKVAAGTLRAIATVPEFLTTPHGAATLAMGGAPAIAQRAVAGTFAVDMAKNLPAQAEAVAKAIQEGDPEKIAETTTGLALSSGFLAGTAHQALRSTPVAPAQVEGKTIEISPEAKVAAANNAPATAAAVQQATEILKPKEGDQNAQTIRSDTGQMRAAGTQLEVLQNKGSENLQQHSPGQPEPVVTGEAASSSGSEVLTAIQKEGTLRNGKSESKQNELQAGPQTKPGINPEAASNDAAAVERRNSKASDAWLEAVSKNDLQASRNAEEELLRTQVGSQRLQELKVLVGANRDWETVRTSGGYGRVAREAASKERARASQERERSGQQAGQSSIGQPVGTYETTQPSAKEAVASGINTGALGEVGMGGAKPGEFAPSRERATGIKNETVDAERQSRGQPAIMAPERLKNSVVWDRVMAKIDIDPGWQARLIQDLQENPRTPSQDEILALDHRYADLQNEYAKATRDGARAFEDNFQVGIDEAKTRASFYESKLNELEQIARKVGTEWGRSGQMRQRLLKEDFSLAAMEARMRAAKGFEPLTESEHAEIAKLQAQIAEKEAASAAAEQKFNERVSQLEAEKSLAEERANVARSPEYPPSVLAHAQRFVDYMHKQGDAARSRLRERLGRTSAGVDPTILSDVAIIGAEHLSAKALDLAKWTEVMVKDVGEWIREHAEEAFKASQQRMSESEEKFFKGADKPTKERVKRTKEDISGRLSDLTESIKKKSSEGEGSPIHSEVRKMVRLLVEQNPDISRDALIDRVHEVLKESDPEITRIEAMDAISGRGKFWTPPQDQVSKTVRDLSTQIRLVAHQMDVEAKKPLPRTGYQPEKLSDAARQEQQKLNELKRKYGVVVTDPAAQLGSVLSARKTYYTNRIKDLKQEISTRDRIVKTKSPSPTDPALEALKKEYEEVRKEHDEIFGKRELTDEQRLKIALSAAERNEASWNERLAEAKKGNFDKTKEPGRKVTSPELEAIRSRTEAVKDEVQELKDIAFPKKTPDEIALQSLKTRLAREKADLQERLAKGDFSPRRKTRETPLDTAAANAKAEVMLLRDKFNAELEKQRYLQKSKAEKIWLGTKEALNLSRAILTSWDVSAVGRQGAFIALGNPLRAAKSIGPMFKALVSEKSAAAVEAEIASRPNAKLYEQSKLFLAPREGGKLTGMEEAFMSKLASKVPGVAASGRAYVTFLNKLRADSFDAMYESLTKGKDATPEELKAISNFINVATGRGNLGKAAGAAETLSTAFFAPRLVASRFQLLAGEPLYLGSARTRYLVAKEYGKFLVGLGVVYSLGMMAGGTVEEDPRSSDFGKIKFGHTRIDPLAGLSQVAVLLSRLATGELKNFRGKVEPIRGNVQYGHRTAADIIATFLRTKLSPIVGNVVDVSTGKNVVGEKVTPGSIAENMTVPLSFRDIYQVMEEQGIPAGTIIGLLSLFGVGVQNYDEQKRK